MGAGQKTLRAEHRPKKFGCAIQFFLSQVSGSDLYGKKRGSSASNSKAFFFLCGNSLDHQSVFHCLESGLAIVPEHLTVFSPLSLAMCLGGRENAVNGTVQMHTGAQAATLIMASSFHSFHNRVTLSPRSCLIQGFSHRKLLGEALGASRASKGGAESLSPSGSQMNETADLLESASGFYRVSAQPPSPKP